MRYQIALFCLLCLTIPLAFSPQVASAQEPPEQIQSALADLSAQVGTSVALADLSFYSFEAQQFADTSLGCPTADETYAQVVTPGYQFLLDYAGMRYDYRVSEDNTIIMLCSIEESPADPTVPQPAPNQITMDQPVLALAPLSGTPGTTVNIIANNFPRSTLVLIGIGRVGSEYEVLQTEQTTTRGTLSTSIAIPTYFNTTDEVVIVAETDNNQLRVVSPVFIINDPATGNTGIPSVSLNPQTGDPGTEVQLTAIGYPANTPVIIGVGPQNGADFSYSLRETTDAQGNLITNIAIPETAQPSRPYIALVQVEADRDYEAISPPFIVTGVAPTPIPDGNEFTTSDIYLIATNDNGQNGVPVGCNDSAIPVTVNFSPTITPLTAALEQLLALNARTYGQSGLYNALYQSELTIEGINILDGVATINLSGNLQLGGVCDSPRTRAQIAQTALQFSTVNSVNIFVNGQPFDDAPAP